MRVLGLGLERVDGLQYQPYPYQFDIKTVAEQPHRCDFMLALDISVPTAPDGKPAGAKVDLSAVVSSFTSLVEKYPRKTDSMKIDIRHIRDKDLPDWVFQDDRRPERWLKAREKKSKKKQAADSSKKEDPMQVDFADTDMKAELKPESLDVQTVKAELGGTSFSGNALKRPAGDVSGELAASGDALHKRQRTEDSGVSAKLESSADSMGSIEVVSATGVKHERAAEDVVTADAMPAAKRSHHDLTNLAAVTLPQSGVTGVEEHAVTGDASPRDSVPLPVSAQ